MQLSDPTEIFDLDDFLPPDGEDRFEMLYADGVLSLDIFYEAYDSAPRNAKRTIRFFQAKYFFKTPFPGYSFFSCPDHRDTPLLDSVVEYGHSDMLDVEQKTSGSRGYKHYRLFLHSTGVAIHAIAQSCEISGEELID